VSHEVSLTELKPIWVDLGRSAGDATAGRAVPPRLCGTRIVWMQATPSVPISRCSPARQEWLSD